MLTSFYRNVMLFILLAWLANSDTNNNRFFFFFLIIYTPLCFVDRRLFGGTDTGTDNAYCDSFCDELASGAWYLLSFLSSL